MTLTGYAITFGALILASIYFLSVTYGWWDRRQT